VRDSYDENDSQPHGKKGKIKADCVDLVTKWRCISLAKSNTVATSTEDGFLYLA
jgi:hypothetical protein